MQETKTVNKNLCHSYILIRNQASLMAQLVKNPPAVQETPVQFLGQEDLLEKGQATHYSILGFPLWLRWKESACNAGDVGSIPGLGRSPGKEKGYPLQYSGLENSMDCTGTIRETKIIQFTIAIKRNTMPRNKFNQGDARSLQ